MIRIKKKIADQLGVEIGRYDTHTHIFEHKLIKTKNLRYKPSYDAKIEIAYLAKGEYCRQAS